MKLINRGIVIIKPKQPFVDWLNQLPDADAENPYSLETLREDRTVLLIPDMPSLEDMEAFINPLKPDLFEGELLNFTDEPKDWPEDLTAKRFDQWFELETHSMVYDAAAIPLTAEEDEDE